MEEIMTRFTNFEEELRNALIEVRSKEGFAAMLLERVEEKEEEIGELKARLKRVEEEIQLLAEDRPAPVTTIPASDDEAEDLLPPAGQRPSTSTVEREVDEVSNLFVYEWQRQLRCLRWPVRYWDNRKCRLKPVLPMFL